MSDPAREFHEDEGDAHTSPQEGRPDWLVGSEELTRRDAVPNEDQAFPTAPPVLPRRVVPAEAPAAQRGPVAWTAAASSIPTLQVTQRFEAEPQGPKAPPASQAAPAPSARSFEPEDEEPDDGLSPLSTFVEDISTEAAPKIVAPRRPRHESWWVVALEALRSDRRVQLLTLGTLLLTVLVLTLWPRSEPGISLRALRHDPGRWDAQRVRVHGRVGDVFGVGGGYAFYLLQGRDTMVVFTRSRRPEAGRSTEVVGMVSTGFLDGAPRQAIFEEPQAP
jgi:hypothetical protein